MNGTPADCVTLGTHNWSTIDVVLSGINLGSNLGNGIEGSVVPGTDPSGRDHFWLVAKPMDAPEEGTDRWAVERGFVSMTPLRLDLTNEQQLENVRSTRGWPGPMSPAFHGARP